MPEPRQGESRGDFVTRCIPIVINDGTATSAEQAVAICNSIWDESKQNNAEGSTLYQIKDVEIFSVGTWWGSMGPMKWTEEDMYSVVKNTVLMMDDPEFGIKPRLKIGHDPDQPWPEAEILEGQMDGDPRLGDIVNFRTKGTGKDTKIIADFMDIVPIVYSALVGKLYTNVSAEMEFSKGIGWFISAVSLLGADIPAVKKLEDLQAFLSDSSVVVPQKAVVLTFSEPIIRGGEMPDPVNGEGKPVKSDPAVVKILEDNDQLRTNYTDIKSKNEALKKENDAKEAELEGYRKQSLEVKFTQQRDKILAPYKEDVEKMALMPAVYDKIVSCLDGQKSGFKQDTTLVINPELAREIAQAYSERVPNKEQCEGGGAGEGGNGGGDAPDEILAREIKKTQSQFKMTYSEAADHLQLTNPKIWKDYHEWTDKVSNLSKIKPT